jgi:hypothetical protein
LRVLNPIAATAAKPDLHPRQGRGPFAAGPFAPGRFVPDLALSIAVIAVVYLLLLGGGASTLFRDADAGWHIRAGERIVAAHALPAADPFSFSKAGQPWMAWEWLSDIAVGSVHQLAGLSGVAFLYVPAIALAI